MSIQFELRWSQCHPNIFDIPRDGGAAPVVFGSADDLSRCTADGRARTSDRSQKEDKGDAGLVFSGQGLVLNVLDSTIASGPGGLDGPAFHDHANGTVVKVVEHLVYRLATTSPVREGHLSSPRSMMRQTRPSGGSWATMQTLPYAFLPGTARYF